ncbi:hypothetical protein [Streptomyces sp. NPDC003247]|uniref:hypothetical protein n=1 Tax=Streptomyces sp. NPDC003247 TaxID=3364677 RepID=UPI0036CA3EE9
MRGPDESVGAVDFGPDGETLVTGDDAGAVELWRVSLPGAEEAIDQLWEAVGRDLTDVERDTFLPKSGAGASCDFF